MNYKAELVVVITVGKIDVIVKDEKILYLPNRRISALCHQIQCKSS
jgi:hypothetical protein